MPLGVSPDPYAVERAAMLASLGVGVDDTTLSLADLRKGNAGSANVAAAVSADGTTNKRYGVNIGTTGAKGDGLADDSFPQVNAATNGGQITYPTGTFLTKSTLTRAVAAHIMGAGMGSSIISWMGSGGANPMMTTLPGGLSTDFGSLRRLRLTGGNVATYCLQMSNLVGITLDQVQLANAVNACLFLNNVNGLAARDCLFVGGTTTSQIVLAAASGGGTNQCIWDNCSFAAHALTQGLQLQPGDVVHLISGCNFEGNSVGAAGIICAGTTSITVLQSFFENWTTACIAATSGTIQNLEVLGGNMAALNTASACIQIGGTPGRISIKDVFFNTLGAGGQCATGISLPTTVTDVEILGNRQPAGNTGTIITIGGVAYPYSDLVINKDIPTAWVGIGAPSAQGGATGKPYGIAPKAGDTYDRQDTLTTANQRRYLCTVGGATPTWVAIY